MEKIIPWVALLLLGSIVYMWFRSRGKSRQQNERIRDLEKQLVSLKARRMTANGGISAGDKLKLLDLIAKVDAIEDDNQLVQLRVADLKRSMINFLQNDKRR